MFSTFSCNYTIDVIITDVYEYVDAEPQVTMSRSVAQHRCVTEPLNPHRCYSLISRPTQLQLCVTLAYKICYVCLLCYVGL